MVKVVITGDFHIGLVGALDDEIIYDLAGSWWKNKPVLLIGDFVDVGLHHGMQFSQKFPPAEQIERARRIFEIMDVKGYVLGNHDKRFFKEVGLNPFFDILGKPCHYVTIDNTLFYIFHGKSAAESVFAEHNKLMRFVRADTIVAGHSHVLAKMDVLQNNKRVTLIRSGSFVRNAEYATDSGLPPTITGFCEYDTYRCIARLYMVNERGQVTEI